MTMHSLALTAAAALVLSTAGAHAESVLLEPVGPAAIEVGDSIALEFKTSADFPDFFGFEAALTYDADILRFTGIDFGAFDTTPTNPLAIPSQAPGATGVQTLALFTAGDIFGTPPSGAFTLGTFNFEAVAASTGTVVTVGSATPDGGLIFAAGDGGLVSIFDGPVSATVVVASDNDMSVIPLPASALLLLTSALGLAGLGRRRRT